MKLYHLTTQHMKFLMTEGIGTCCEEYRDLRPQLNVPLIVHEEQDRYKIDEKARWYYEQPRIHCIAEPDMERWKESRELGRVMHFQEERSKLMYRGHIFACFDAQKNDVIWVCEAEWLRKYHTGELDRSSSHWNFALSRTEEQGVRGFVLPEYMLGTMVAQERIEWIPIPDWLTPVPFTTFVPKQPTAALRF